MIVEFKRNGRQKRMNDKVARVLLAKGIIRVVSDDEPAPIQTEVPAAPVEEVVPAAEAAEPTAEITAPPADGLDKMDKDQLLKFAEDLGIKIHGRTGEEKIREIIREHTK